MNRLLLCASLALASALAPAQNCLDPNRGTLLADGLADVLLPMQSIGFPFPLGGNTYTHVHITDHGYVQLSNAGVPAPIGGGALYSPTITNFTLGSPKVCALYADIVGTGGGQIFLNSTPTRCLISWVSMQNYGTPAPRFDFQMALYPSGEVRLVFGANVTNQSTLGAPFNHGICGITPGAGAAATPSGDLFVAPGPTVVFANVTTTFEAWNVPQAFDLANACVVLQPLNPGYLVTATTAANCATATTNGAGCGGLSMTASALPIIGSSDFKFTLAGLVNQPLTLMAFGSAAIAAPGLPLGGGCHALMNFDIGAFALTGPKVFTLPIPNDPSYLGTTLGAQAVELLTTPATPPFKVSNGFSLVLGF
jgi:hypothetical protein